MDSHTTRYHRRLVLAIAVVVVVVAAGLFASIGFRAKSVTQTTSSMSCAIIAAQGNATSNDFTIRVDYSGQWNMTLKTYSAFDTSPAYLKSSSCYTGTGGASLEVAAWNPSGEQTVVAMAHKLDGSNANMTVSVSWGAAVRSNSTTSTYGSISAQISIAP